MASLSVRDAALQRHAAIQIVRCDPAAASAWRDRLQLCADLSCDGEAVDDRLVAAIYTAVEASIHHGVYVECRAGDFAPPRALAPAAAARYEADLCSAAEDYYIAARLGQITDLQRHLQRYAHLATTASAAAGSNLAAALERHLR